jgi:hypothetical protein
VPVPLRGRPDTHAVSFLRQLGENLLSGSSKNGIPLAFSCIEQTGKVIAPSVFDYSLFHQEVSMNHKLRTAMVAFALVGGLAACDNPRRDAANSPNNDGATARNERSTSPRGGIIEPNRTSQGQTGNELEETVKAKLQSDEQLRNAPIRVSADAEKNAVTLSGTVPSEEARNKAVDLAKSAGVTVNDKIEVKPVA